MNVKLDHPSKSMVDQRIMDMGFQDISWKGDETGMVHKCIGGKDVYIYVPDVSREDFNGYVVKTNNGLIGGYHAEIDLIEWTQDVEQVIGLLTKLHLAALATTFIEAHKR